MVTATLKTLEDELANATKADIESFRRFLGKKSSELKKLQKDLADLKECERHMTMKRENMEAEIHAATTKKNEIEIETTSSKELQKLKKEEEMQEAEIARIEAILCDNVDRCLEILLAKSNRQTTTFDHIEAELSNCRDLLVRLKERNSGKMVEAIRYLKYKNEVKQKVKSYYANKLLRHCCEAFKDVVKRHSEVVKERSGVLESVHKEELKGRADNLPNENKAQDEYEALDTTYNQMISECVSNPGLQRLMQKPNTRASEIPSKIEEDKATSKLPHKRSVEKSTFGHSNFSYIFPSTFKERVPYIIPVVNEGLPLSDYQSPEELSKTKRGRRTQFPARIELEQENSNFVPLVIRKEQHRP
eukprot:TRINITY_DN10578_c0_g4_i1.p1 TRINITY_DN10578_c0_g4~~TRINITY_DN10578_c0_g4_i1.p1  ORF type:complete len:361 (-),score=94.56 TRINITY_DN10578_c0_g4_i1:113-1195(-)